MGEYQDWDKPELMARRGALRDNLTVKEVLARSALMKQVEKQAFRQTPGPAVDA